jgi:hypothetical protein
MNRHGALEFCPHRLPWSSSSARLAGDCQRRVRHRDQHLNRAASLVEADPAEVSQTALGEVVVVRGGVFLVQLVAWLGLLTRSGLGGWC